MVDRIILPDDLKGQVVDDTESANKKKSKDSKYLSKNDNSVKIETKSLNSAKTRNSKPLAKSDQKLKTPEKKISQLPKKKLELADLALQPPQHREPSTYSPPATTDDYLPKVKEGALTSLNTREFKFYSYFERIKERLRMYWEPQLKQRVNQLYATGRQLPNYDLITKLNIILNKDGELSKIFIAKNSGFEDIDQAAIKAFELAAPFPNPPSGMVEEGGSVHLSWSFVIETRGISNIFVFLSRR